MKVNLAWKAPVFFYTIPHNVTPAYPILLRSHYFFSTSLAASLGQPISSPLMVSCLDLIPVFQAKTKTKAKTKLTHI